MGLAVTLLLAVPVIPIHAEENAAPVSRAEYEALREELRELRSQQQELRRQTEQADQAAPDDSGSAESGPIVEWDRALTFTAPEGRFSLNIGGRIQPRYEFERREGESNHSSFSMRRPRLQFGGHAYSRDLTYRVTPELNRTASLRDGWINYRFTDSARVRFGHGSKLHIEAGRIQRHDGAEWRDTDVIRTQYQLLF